MSFFPFSFLSSFPTHSTITFPLLSPFPPKFWEAAQWPFRQTTVRWSLGLIVILTLKRFPWGATLPVRWGAFTSRETSSSSSKYAFQIKHPTCSRFFSRKNLLNSVPGCTRVHNCKAYLYTPHSMATNLWVTLESGTFLNKSKTVFKKIFISLSHFRAANPIFPTAPVRVEER